MPKLTDDEIRAYIDSRISRTLSTSDSELRGERVKALDFYYGRPMGNEIEGRAQVVSKDMMDTIEWIMPSLMRVFAGKESVQFDPVGPEDEAIAKQETAAVSHVLWKKNPGFILIHNWIKDALMQKVGYIKYWWETSKKAKYQSYEGLDADQLTQLIQDLEQKGEVEIIEQSEEESGFTIKLRHTTEYGCLKIDNVPPDETIVDSECRAGVKMSKLAGHFRKLTRSELMEMGYSKEKVAGLTSYQRQENLTERMARDTINESVGDDAQDELDWASVEITMLECYAYLDVDGDGIAELRYFLIPGEGVLENEECMDIQMESWTPLIIPHRHSGLSIYDIMEDLQRIKTALQRGLLDNVYFTMNPRTVYDKNTVDVSMLQINRPGGHVANDGPVNGAVMPMIVQPMAGTLLPVIDYFDSVKESRTGVGKMTSGVDANVLAQSTKGAYMDAQSAANQRIEMIARIFAETGLASLYQSIHKMLAHHQDKPMQFKLKSNWITVNPSTWDDRTDLTVSVGLGNASRDEIRNNLVMLAQAQEKAKMGDPKLIQPKNIHGMFLAMQEELGVAGDFITDPSSPEYQKLAAQPPPPDPYIQGEQMKSQTQLQKAQIDAATKVRGQDMEQATEIAKLEVTSGIDLAKLGVGAELNARTAAEKGNGSSTIT
jgi:hypothetical protein